jgi:hypothetical protein
MTFVMLLPAILSFLVLGAHWLRAGNLPLVAAILALIALIAVRRPWAARTLQAALAVGVLEWVRTLIGLAAERMRAGEPVVRLAVILAGVAAVTGLAALTFSSARLRRWYRVGEVKPDGNERA